MNINVIKRISKIQENRNLIKAKQKLKKDFNKRLKNIHKEIRKAARLGFSGVKIAVGEDYESKVCESLAEYIETEGFSVALDYDRDLSKCMLTVSWEDNEKEIQD